MIDFFIKHAQNPLSDIKIDLGVDEPLWKYVQKAIQLTMYQLYRSFMSAIGNGIHIHLLRRSSIVAVKQATRYPPS